MSSFDDAASGSDPVRVASAALSTDPKTRWWAARNPVCPEGTLARLSRDREWDVRVAVAEHENTPPDALRRLAEDPDKEVRWAVAANPNTPSDVLARLARDSHRDVAEAAAR